MLDAGDPGGSPLSRTQRHRITRKSVSRFLSEPEITVLTRGTVSASQWDRAREVPSEPPNRTGPPSFSLPAAESLLAPGRVALRAGSSRPSRTVEQPLQGWASPAKACCDELQPWYLSSEHAAHSRFSCESCSQSDETALAWRAAAPGDRAADRREAMRTTEDRTRRRPSLRASVVASATALLLLGPGAGTAQADREQPVPSRDDVRTARSEAVARFAGPPAAGRNPRAGCAWRGSSRCDFGRGFDSRRLHRLG